MSSLWQSWDEVRRSSAAKKGVYFYGRSEDWVHKAIKGIPKDLHRGIIDRNKEYHGKDYLGLSITPIEEIDSLENYYFVITAGEYDGIVETLESYGLQRGGDFCCSPDFKDYSVVKNFYSKVVTGVVACSDYNDTARARSSRGGGGLYHFDSSDRSFAKMATGSYRQIEVVGDRIYAVEYVVGRLDCFDLSYQLLFSVDLPGTNLCGLSYCSEDNVFYVANAGTDEILKYSPKTREIEKIQYFMRAGTKREAHINDLCVSDGKLFVSCFSKSGNYKFGVFDGGVSVIDLANDAEPMSLIDNLWKPHSPRIIDGYLYVLDSMRGTLCNGKFKQLLSLGGFVRGLDKMEDVWAVGQSQDMYISEHHGGSRTISIDAGLYLCDVNSNLSRFFACEDIMNIHDVRIFDVY